MICGLRSPRIICSGGLESASGVVAGLVLGLRGVLETATGLGGARVRGLDAPSPGLYLGHGRVPFHDPCLCRHALRVCLSGI